MADSSRKPQLAEDRQRARTRRRFARRQWRRRWLRWKPILAILVTLGLAATAIWLVLFSRYLAVSQVQVEGNAVLTSGEIRAAAAVPEGRPLMRLDLTGIERRIEGLAAVRKVRVTRSWPDTVVIELTERTPVAVIDLGSGVRGDIRGLDQDGVVFRTYPKAPPGLPLIKTAGNTGGEALREGAHVIGALPEQVRARVAHLAVVTVDQIWLVLRDGRVVLWGSADDSEQKAEVLAALLKQPAKTYDVSVPGQPTTSDQPPRTPIP